MKHVRNTSQKVSADAGRFMMTWVTGTESRASIAMNARASMLNGVTRRSTSV